MLQVQDTHPASDCGRAKQLFLSPLPAGSPRFHGEASFTQTEKQTVEEYRQQSWLQMTAILFRSRIH
jgi:hypothetical protein